MLKQQTVDYYYGKQVLVPGGAGFIGSHLVASLVKLGAQPIVLDNLQTGSRNNLSEHDVRFIEASVIDAVLPAADIIFNLACPASPVHYQRDPIETWKTSVLGVVNIAQSAVTAGARVVHASTSEVYGDPLQHPQTESYWGNVNPIGPRACYDEGKRAAETFLMDYNRTQGLDVRLPRIFNTYGPNMAHNDGRVVSNFITQALSDQDITIYGDGSNTRSFCYVSDMVEALLEIGACEGIGGQVINLGNPGEFTILELADMVISMTESKSKITLKDLPQDDPLKRKPDITKAQELLGWSPRVDLPSGLEQTIAYFARNLSNS